jgi:hypothetical protein
MTHKINDDIKHLVLRVAETDENTVCTEVANKLYETLTNKKAHPCDNWLSRKPDDLHLRTLIKYCKNSIIHMNLYHEQSRTILHSFILETRKIGKKTYYKVYNAWVDNYCLCDWILNKNKKIDPETFKEFGAFRYRDLDAKSNFVDKLEIMLKKYTPARSRELFNVDVGFSVVLLYHQTAIKGMRC